MKLRRAPPAAALAAAAAAGRSAEPAAAPSRPTAATTTTTATAAMTAASEATSQWQRRRRRRRPTDGTSLLMLLLLPAVAVAALLSASAAASAAAASAAGVEHQQRPDCARGCPLTVDPVCGPDGRSYMSACVALCATPQEDDDYGAAAARAATTAAATATATTTTATTRAPAPTTDAAVALAPGYCPGDTSVRFAAVGEDDGLAFSPPHQDPGASRRPVPAPPRVPARVLYAFADEGFAYLGRVRLADPPAERRVFASSVAAAHAAAAAAALRASAGPPAAGGAKATAVAGAKEADRAADGQPPPPASQSREQSAPDGAGAGDVGGGVGSARTDGGGAGAAGAGAGLDGNVLIDGDLNAAPQEVEIRRATSAGDVYSRVYTFVPGAGPFSLPPYNPAVSGASLARLFAAESSGPINATAAAAPAPRPGASPPAPAGAPRRPPAQPSLPSPPQARAQAQAPRGAPAPAPRLLATSDNLRPGAGGAAAIASNEGGLAPEPEAAWLGPAGPAARAGGGFTTYSSSLGPSAPGGGQRQQQQQQPQSQQQQQQQPQQQQQQAQRRGLAVPLGSLVVNPFRGLGGGAKARAALAAGGKAASPPVAASLPQQQQQQQQQLRAAAASGGRSAAPGYAPVQPLQPLQPLRQQRRQQSAPSESLTAPPAPKRWGTWKRAFVGGGGGGAAGAASASAPSGGGGFGGWLFGRHAAAAAAPAAGAAGRRRMLQLQLFDPAAAAPLDFVDAVVPGAGGLQGAEGGGARNGSVAGSTPRGAGTSPRAPARSLLSIIGAVDSRRPCPVGQWPYTALGQITGLAVDGDFMCSGALVAPDRVLTAAHCVWDDRDARAFFRDLSFSPAQYKTPQGVVRAPVGKVPWEHVTILQAYADDPNFGGLAFDVAVIKLKEPIGNTLGWLGYRSACEGGGAPLSLTLAGYPGDSPKTRADDAFLGGCYADACGVLYDCRSGTNNHTCDSYVGQSGAAMWDRSYYARMVHTLGVLPGFSTTNAGVTLTPFLVEMIARFM